jgi:hypothetical protein
MARRRNIACVVLALAAPATAWQFGCNKNDTFAGRAPFVNPGPNELTLAMCPKAAVAPNGTCAPAQLVACADVIDAGNGFVPGARFPAGSPVYAFNIPGEAAYMVLFYASPQPFSYHVIASAAPVRYAPVAYAPQAFVVPYGGAGGNASAFCDVAADCAGGAACAAGRCAPPPSPSPSASALPVPSPTPGPPARACNLTGKYLQFCPGCKNLDAAVGFRPGATIDIASAADGTFTFACVSNPQVSTCPLGGARFNGTGTLDAVGNGFTINARDATGAPVVVVGVVNETFTCGTITLLSHAPAAGAAGAAAAAAAPLPPPPPPPPGAPPRGAPPTPPPWPVEWDAAPPPPALIADLSVAAATYVGGGATGQLVASGVAVLAAPADGSAVVAVAGNGAAAPAGARVIELLGAGSAANGTLLILRAAAVGARASGVAAACTVRLGARVDAVRANARGDAVVAGSFGIAVVTGLASCTPSVVWHDDLSALEPGSCGVCCADSGATVCRVDIGDDGVVAASFAVEAPEGHLWGAYSPSGARFAAAAQGAAALSSIFVNAARRELGLAFFYVSNTGRESMIMPRVQMFTYDVGATALTPAYADMPWDAHVYREPGPCNGNVADGRILDARVGRDGSLLVSGRSDGGNSPFYCGLRNVTRVTPMSVLDRYNTPYDMQAQGIVNFLKIDAPVRTTLRPPAAPHNRDPSDPNSRPYARPTTLNQQTGEVIVGQIQLTRLGAGGGGGGNSLFNRAAQTDAAGRVYELQAAACCIPNMGNTSINGQRTVAPGDATALHILSADLTERFHWTSFASAAAPRDASEPVELDVRGGAVALVLNAPPGMVESGVLPGAGADAAGALVAYLVVLPTAAAGT